LVAVAALLLSLSGIIYQIFTVIQGADVELIPPEQVVLKVESFNNEKYLNFIIPIAYLNTGNTGNNAIIKNEEIDIHLDNKGKYSHKWIYFVFTYSEKDELKEEDRKPAHSFVVNAGEAKAHETVFVAYPEYFVDKSSNPNKNFLKLITFLNCYESLLSENPISDFKELKLTIRSEIIGDSNKLVECILRISKHSLDQLRDRKRGWTILSCKGCRNDFGYQIQIPVGFLR
jgi:hypothetical protein